MTRSGRRAVFHRAPIRLFLLATSLAWATGTARAQDDTTAASSVGDATRAAVRKLGGAGVAAYREQNYADALDKLEKAYRLMPVPSLALWSARTLVARGAWTRAAERYLAAGRLELGPGDQKIQLEAQRLAAQERAALMPRIPSLRVVVEGATAAEVEVSIDGVALPSLLLGEDWPLDPGAHGVVGVRNGERVEATPSVAEGEHAEVTLRFTRAAPPPPEPEAPAVAPSVPAATVATSSTPSDAAREAEVLPWRAEPFPWQTVGWVSLGVGGAVLTAGTVLTVVALGERDDVLAGPDCVGNQCLRTREVERLNSMLDLSAASVIAGALLAGAGAGLVLAAPGSPADTSVALGLTGVSVSGTF